MALLPNALGKLADPGVTLVLATVVSTGGVAAKLNITRNAPPEQSANAPKVRGCKRPHCEAEEFIVKGFLGWIVNGWS